MKKWIPIILIVVLMIVTYIFRMPDFFSFEMLKMHRETLNEYVSEHFALTSLLFILMYLVSTALSLPIGFYLSLLGGFLFPQPLSTLYVILGATAGASTLFWAARTAFSDILRKKASPFLSKMKEGFNENAACYMLFLRLIPAFPFWLVNLAPAFLGVPFFTYLWTTAVGILPAVVVFTQFGAGLDKVFQGDQEFSIDNILNRDIKIALAALAILVLIPIVFKKLRKKKT